MKFFKIGIILSFITMFAFACTQNAPVTNNSTANVNKTAVNTTPGAQPTAAGDELAGAREVYKNSCVGCHKADGSGGEKVLDTGDKIKVPDYKSSGAMNASDDKLYNYIANGEEGEMPAFKNKLSEQQMRDLVKMIRKDFQGK